MFQKGQWDLNDKMWVPPHGEECHVGASGRRLSASARTSRCRATFRRHLGYEAVSLPSEKQGPHPGILITAPPTDICIFSFFPELSQHHSLRHVRTPHRQPAKTGLQGRHEPRIDPADFCVLCARCGDTVGPAPRIGQRGFRRERRALISSPHTCAIPNQVKG